MNKDIKQTIKNIEKLVERFIDDIHQGIAENTEHEMLGDYHSATYTTYDVSDDINDLLYKIGVEVDNRTLIDLYKQPKTIEEIEKELTENSSLSDFEELEEVETIRDADSEPKYVYITEIVKHIPTGKFYKFSTQTQGDYSGVPEFRGEVIQKEITITQWLSK